MKKNNKLHYKVAWYKYLSLTLLTLMSILLIQAVNAAAPTIVSTTPYDGEMAVKPNSTITAIINDTDGDLLDINFSIYNGTTWRTMRTYANVPSGTYTANTNGYMTKQYTDYQWKLTIDDHTGNIIEQTFNLKTRGLLKLKYVTTVGAATAKGEGQIMPLMADIDKDGVQELVFAAGGNITALNAVTGQIEWRVPGAEGTAIEMVDLNKDGTLEILAGMASNNLRVMAINGNGTIRWTSPRLSGDHQSLFPILAYDTDGDGYPTIYFGAQDSHPDPYSGNISEYNGAIHMLNHNGQLISSTWVQKPCWGGFAIGDTDEDGKLELYMGDRRDGYHDIPGKGLYALDPDTLEELWTRPDIQHSSPMPILADVFGDSTMEVIAEQITLRGPLVLDSKTGNSIVDYQNKGLPTHATGTVADYDNDGNLEMLFGTSYPSNAPKDFAALDLVTGVVEYRTTLEAHTTWPPKVGDVTGDGIMEIVVGLGEQSDYWSDYPIIVYNNEYQIIDRVDMSDLKLSSRSGQFSTARFFDVDNDGLNEIVIGAASGKLFVFETEGVSPNPKPRTWVQEYSEYRTGEPKYVEPPGQKAPYVKSVTPQDNATNISANPILTASIIDYQKDRFDVSFEIYQGFEWRQLATYTNVSNGNFTSNSNPYVSSPSSEYKWRITTTDSKGNSKQYEYKFVTTDAINTTAPIVSEIYPTTYMTAVPINTTSLIFEITDSTVMSYNLTTIPNIGSGYATNVASGQYSVPIAGLQNNMDYIWRLEVSDSESITYKEYYFSTPWDLNINVDGNGIVDTTPDAPFAHNTEVTLNAIPNIGNTFLGWNENLSGYNSTATITLDTPKSVTARFRTETGKILADSEFDESLNSQEILDNAPYQDWYESRNQGEYRNLLTLDESNIGGNNGKKAKLQASTAGNAYLTQDFQHPLNDTFVIQWDVYVDNIINRSTNPDRAAMMLIGDNFPVSSNGPNYQAARNFVWLAFYKDGGAETGTMNLVTTLNNATEMVLATDVTLDSWHTIKVSGNLETDTYDVYLDDLLVGSQITARTNKNNLTHISFAQWNDGAGTFYIDNVKEPDGPIICIDSDLDGFNVTGLSCGPIDCNDEDPSINPLATEVCDSVDNNCDGNIDEGLTTTYYQDSDSDLFGNPLVAQNACSMPSGYILDNSDCDDSNNAVNPIATEICDNDIDDNCDASIDEGCSIGLAGWDYRKSITVNKDNVIGDVNSFPMLVRLDDADLASKAQSDGEDIVFTDSDGLSILDYEIEKYDNGELVAWVKVDVSSSVDKMIYMYYGNNLASSQENPQGLWSEYEAVHHFEELNGDLTDSSSNNNNGQILNGVNQGINGKIGQAYNFDGVDDRASLPQLFSAPNAFTIESWVNTNNKQGYVISQRDNAGRGSFIQYYPPEGNFQMYVNSRILRVPASFGSWHHVVGAYDGTNAILYVDGTSVSGSATLVWPTLPTIIGDRSALARAYQGDIDEMRISHDFKSQEYVLVSYINQNNPETFYTVGSEEQ